ncbi:integrating conjugative element, PFGI_1 class, ParB family protein [Halopseudomonas litoralis]|uniref:Integrating conjugative element, PFGI_1 class, ParB family protein n=1 Tax=Halopseudomonas litoralis TaxID=797277 RepID=A0A1H1Q035_9GAMM|nr:ParB family protein [Halopseudomonas litoralis]SDS16607.1 integrating conjugative element, PFGI_1 class, ParB family protein [Halopseudomonas litoralis]
MADFTSEEMADKLLAAGFSRSGPVAQALSDPLVDTPVVVTLDELRAYELNPRLTRNPLYAEIKASIRERGLDAPPAITRRPDADHYIIRNGGNTRLAILRELWAETKDERFFRISCLFRPWPQHGEIVALTGHLAENELHGRLTFIERALGVEKARELYEQESDGALSQSELARRLAADGYPVPQPHISRMQETIRYLLPAIPNVLYSGLGRHQAERLVMLRKAADLIWQQHAPQKNMQGDFDAIFHDVLASFDAQPDAFSPKRVMDELVGQMADLLELDYSALELDIDNIDRRQRAVTSPPQMPASSETSVPETGALTDLQPSPATSAPALRDTASTPETPSEQHVVTKASGDDLPSAAGAALSGETEHENGNAVEATLQAHIVSPVDSTERLQAIQQLVANHTGEERPDFAETVLRAIPVQVGGLFPITDVWYIEPSLDAPDRLRIHLAQFAGEIAEEADMLDCIEAVGDGVGFICATDSGSPKTSSPFSLAVQALLCALSATHEEPSLSSSVRLEHVLGPLLHGVMPCDEHNMPRLSDNGLVKLFRMLRLARRLQDLETGAADRADN